MQSWDSCLGVQFFCMHVCIETLFLPVSKEKVHRKFFIYGKYFDRPIVQLHHMGYITARDINMVNLYFCKVIWAREVPQ